MKREIVQKGAPILEKVALPFDLDAQTAEIATVVSDIADTLQYLLTTRDFTKGLGLAVPQIGHSLRAFGLIPASENIKIYLNPEIIEKSAETDLQYEGCLSFFDVRGLVPRSLEIRLRYFDVLGTAYEEVFSAAKARLIQHKVDHLVTVFGVKLDLQFFLDLFPRVYLPRSSG